MPDMEKLISCLLIRMLEYSVYNMTLLIFYASGLLVSVPRGFLHYQLTPRFAVCGSRTLLQVSTANQAASQLLLYLNRHA